jgi:hypothetical protein
MVALTLANNAIDGSLNPPTAAADGTFNAFNAGVNATISTVDQDDPEFNVGEAVLINGNTVPYTYQGTDGSGGMYLLNTDNGAIVFWTNQDTSTGFTGVTYTIQSDPLVCFAPGTLIATPKGETAVEALQIGDLVTTAAGRTVPVKWIGRQTVVKLFAGDRARPVRVAAGALGDGLPHTDLVLTADHALIIDGLAINAGALVNGTTIMLDPLAALPDRVTYYHVETEEHDVILANGAPAETFVDYVDRQVFDNHAEYVKLYGEERIITEMSLTRISTARLLPPALRKRLAGRAAA